MSTAKTDTIHIKIEKNILVTKQNVTLGDIAKIECVDQVILRKLKQKKIYSFLNPKDKKRVIVAFSVLKIIELIHEDYPNLTVSNEGEADFILEYVADAQKPAALNIIKTVLLCIIIFFGAAFTIMAFNNDVGITEMFGKFYYQVMGTENQGVTELEVCYCIGLAVGIIIFFNHIGHKKITHDPTPIQIQMRKYETDIDTTFIENAGRKGHNIDVR